MIDVYESCPVYQNELITLKKLSFDDTDELFKCYSDANAAPFFNSDNCHGDTFFYTTIERFKQTMEMWDYCYKSRMFVRWSIAYNRTDEIIGTVEMFHRRAEDEFDHFGIIRIDLRSMYENTNVISAILEISNTHFYNLFNVPSILTKAIPEAKERIKALQENGYAPLGKKLLGYDHYYVRSLISAD
jgi:ribosomal-protein-alanine N-acetyltransferase